MRLFAPALISVCLLSLGTILANRPDLGPILSLPLLIASFWPILRAWHAARGTTLRPAIVWAGIAVALGILAQIQAMAAPLSSGRPVSGHWAYVSSLATLAGLISILGARTPGGGAWAMLMGLLVLVFLLPWLEGSGLANARGGMDRLRLDHMWSLFYVLLIIAGVTNFLTTRYALASLLVGSSLIAELTGLLATSWEPSRRAMMWSIGPALLGMGLIQAIVSARTVPTDADPLTRLWLGFRDHWGVVWALRVRERFNRAAEASRWPIRIAWQGPIFVEPGEIPEAAVKTLATLLRRFADEETIAQTIRKDEPRPCPAGAHGG
jgi:hypothetical protein